MGKLDIFDLVTSTWNANDPWFDWKRPCFAGLKPQNRGQTGSRGLQEFGTQVTNISWTPPFAGLDPVRRQGSRGADGLRKEVVNTTTEARFRFGLGFLSMNGKFT